MEAITCRTIVLRRGTFMHLVETREHIVGFSGYDGGYRATNIRLGRDYGLYGDEEDIRGTFVGYVKLVPLAFINGDLISTKKLASHL